MKIALTAYDPEWPLQYEAEREKILGIIGRLSPDVEHIGSTSVPGLAAKPTLDILVGMANGASLNATVRPMIEAGYFYHAAFEDSWPTRRFFVQFQNPDSLYFPENTIRHTDEIPPRDQNPTVVHIHTMYRDSHDWRRHIGFRDLLRKDEKVRAGYEQLKRQLAEREWERGSDYAAAKTEFIRMVSKKIEPQA